VAEWRVGGHGVEAAWRRRAAAATLARLRRPQVDGQAADAQRATTRQVVAHRDTDAFTPSSTSSWLAAYQSGGSGAPRRSSTSVTWVAEVRCCSGRPGIARLRIGLGGEQDRGPAEVQRQCAAQAQGVREA